MSALVTDCLVFKFEEIDSDSGKLDNTMYVIYDKRNQIYLIRGRRRWTPIHQSCTYSYQCEFAKDLAYFIEYSICKENRINEILYNYDNLPENPDDITFDFLKEYDHSDYELSGYNNQAFSTTRLLSHLRMLRNVFNYY